MLDTKIFCKILLYPCNRLLQTIYERFVYNPYLSSKPWIGVMHMAYFVMQHSECKCVAASKYTMCLFFFDNLVSHASEVR